MGSKKSSEPTNYSSSNPRSRYDLISQTIDPKYSFWGETKAAKLLQELSIILSQLRVLSRTHCAKPMTELDSKELAAYATDLSVLISRIGSIKL